MTQRQPLLLVLLIAAGCGSDPQYVQPQVALEIGAEGVDAEVVTTTVTLPVEPETDIRAGQRAALAEQLGLPADQVPYVRLDDFAVAIELTIKNLSDQPGVARFAINGGNQFFYYVPDNFVPEGDDETPLPPPLIGGYPLEVPARGQVTTLVREDEVREASLDLELITRGGLNPIAAILVVHESLREWQPVEPIDPMDPAAGTRPVGDPISLRAFGQMVRFDVSFSADQHMVLELSLRVRDHRGILHPELLDAPADELAVFEPAEFTPVLPTMRQ